MILSLEMNIIHNEIKFYVKRKKKQKKQQQKQQRRKSLGNILELNNTEIITETMTV